MTSAKNKLQEYYQSRGLKLPTYTTIYAEGPAHDLIWICALTTDDNIETGGRGSSKKEAEKNAAEIALQRLILEGRIPLQKHSEERLSSYYEKKPKKLIELTSDIYIFVDVENMHHFVTRLLNEVDFYADNYQQSSYYQAHIYIFGATHHPTFKKLKKDESDCEGVFENRDKFIKIHFEGVESMHRDAADVMMCVTAGRVLNDREARYAYFVSSDRFIASLDDIFDGSHVCPDYESFIGYL